MYRNILTVVGITILFLGVVVTPMTLGYDIRTSDRLEVTEAQSSEGNDGLMDSAWSMYQHDVRHTGQSPYSTVDTLELKWRFETYGGVLGSSVIDNNGIIYIGARDFYAVYPNGTLKWKYDTPHIVYSAAAIDANGIIYVGNAYGDTNLYAFYPDGSLKWKYPTGNIFSSPAITDNGTILFGEGSNIIALYPNGTLKWKYHTNDFVWSSPAIGLDSTIYCGSDDGYLYALYPNNGSLKWKFKTGDWVGRGPSIAEDGTIYFGSWDGHLYACYTNGTLRWKVGVGASTTPVIAEDGTIYIGSRKLTAVYPNNGSIKWIFDPGPDRWITGGNPCISAEGTIYFGTDNWEDGTGEIIAVDSDGTELWRFRMGPVLSAPAIGKDGTVYVGCSTTDDGYLNAFGVGELEVDANGPYYGLINQPVQFEGYSKGGYSPHSYLWDFGDTHTSEEQNPSHTYTNPGNYTVVLTVTDNESDTAVDITFAWIQEANEQPNIPNIDGPTRGKVGDSYDYSFNATDPDGNDIWYHIGWGDKEIIYVYGPYHSGEAITLSYTWSKNGTYIISCWARDVYGEESDIAELEVEIPRNRFVTNLWYHWFLERFPILESLLTLIRA